MTIGVTGGIGSGKSTVCKIIEILGYPVYYADDSAKWLMNHNLKKEIVALFGIEAYKDDQLNRSWIAQQAFSNKDLLERLNALVHPAVAADFRNWAQSSKSALHFYEAALIFENDSHQRFERTILVTASEEVRIERVLSRDSHRNRNDVANIIANQMPEDKKVALADIVIENEGHHSLIEQTIAAVNRVSITQ